MLLLNQQPIHFILLSSFAGRLATYHEHDIPDAPAFRIVSRHQVDEIVERLRTPTASSQAGGHSTANANTLMHSPQSAQSQKEAITRLSAPTHMSRMRAEMEPYRLITELNGKLACGSIVVNEYKKKTSKH